MTDMAGFTLKGVGIIEAKKSAKKDERPEVTIPGIYGLAALDQVLADVKAVRDELETEVKAAARAEFLRKGTATKCQPENFRGIEDGASASMEMRKRSKASALSDEEIALCDELGIEYVVDEKVIETYVINPTYLEDEEVMKALEKVVGEAVRQHRLPLDILKRQEGVKKTILIDTALATLFTKSKDVVEKALSFCCTMAVGKSKFPGGIEAAIKVAELLVPAFKAKADAAAAAKPKTRKAA
jgi:hypothetical protein